MDIQASTVGSYPLLRGGDIRDFREALKGDLSGGWDNHLAKQPRLSGMPQLHRPGLLCWTMHPLRGVVDLGSPEWEPSGGRRTMPQRVAAAASPLLSSAQRLLFAAQPAVVQQATLYDGGWMMLPTAAQKPKRQETAEF